MTREVSSTTGITGFIEIFEGRLVKIKLNLKKELSKAKHERDRKAIRRIIGDAKKLTRSIKEMRKSNSQYCPHCGKEL